MKVLIEYKVLKDIVEAATRAMVLQDVGVDNWAGWDFSDVHMSEHYDEDSFEALVETEMVSILESGNNE